MLNTNNANVQNLKNIQNSAYINIEDEDQSQMLSEQDLQQ